MVENMNENKKIWFKGEDAEKRFSYLIRIVIILIIIFLLVRAVGHFSTGQTDSTAQGKARLTELESQDVKDSRQTIDTLRSQWAAEDEQAAETLKARYKTTMIMGDSLAQKLIEYEILGTDTVAARRGITVSELAETTAAVTSAEPKYVILTYGLDDLDTYRADASSFIRDYSVTVDTIKQNLPNAKICVCSITPVSDAVINKDVEYSYTTVYNTALKQMCTDKSLTYIDATDLVTAYSGDGIHPAKSFFASWAQRMADSAGI